MPLMPSIHTFDEGHLESLSSCPWCDSTAAHRLFEEKGYPYDECASCGLIFLSTRLRRDAVRELYDSTTYNASRDLRFERRRAEKQLAMVLPLPPGARVFEHGAGIGCFVSVCRQAGLEAAGCDLGQSSVEDAKRLNGVDLVLGDLDAVPLAPGSLDLFVSFNVLSHLYEPWRYFERIERLLKPGGRLFLRTGDRTGRMRRVRWGDWSAPQHVFHYHRELLRSMMKRAGLNVTKIAPAFDSDYPYFLYDFSRDTSTAVRRVAGRVCSYTILAWTLLGLPKDDVYIVGERRSAAEWADREET